MPHLRQAIGHTDGALPGMVAFYHIWCLGGWYAIMSLSLSLADYLAQKTAPYLAYLDWLPGYTALPALMAGPDCGGSLPRAQLAYGAGFAFIGLCWLGYFLLVAPRYLRALHRLGSKVASATSGDAVLDLGWKRANFRFMPSWAATLYLLLTFAALIDTLIHPHLVEWGCSRPWLAPVGAGSFHWLGYHWIQLELVWCGLALLAPHALLLLDQAWVMTHEAKRAVRRRPAPVAPTPPPLPPAGKVRKVGAVSTAGRHTVERNSGFWAQILDAWQGAGNPAAPAEAPATPPQAAQPDVTPPGATRKSTARTRQRNAMPPLEEILAATAQRWSSESIQAMRANDDYPTAHMHYSSSYYKHLAKAARKLRGRQRRAAQAGGQGDPALLRAEYDLAEGALRNARNQLAGLAPQAPERMAAEAAIADLQAHVDVLARRLR